MSKYFHLRTRVHKRSRQVTLSDLRYYIVIVTRVTVGLKPKIHDNKRLFLFLRLLRLRSRPCYFWIL